MPAGTRDRSPPCSSRRQWADRARATAQRSPPCRRWTTSNAGPADPMWKDEGRCRRSFSSSIELELGQVVPLCSPENVGGLLGLEQHEILEHEGIHLGVDETVERFSWVADYGLAADIEARVDDHRAAGLRFEALHQSIKTPVPLLVYGLDAGRIVHVRDGRQRRLRHVHPLAQI